MPDSSASTEEVMRELFFTTVPHMESLIFAPPDVAEKNSLIHQALRSAPWGEFRSLMPGDELERLVEQHQKDWLEDSEEGDPPYETPHDDERFDPEWVSGFSEGDYPDWLQKQQELWLPDAILERWGKLETSVLNGNFWTIDPAGEVAIVALLQGSGFRVTRRDDLRFY